MNTKDVIRNYWDYRSESYNNGVIDQSEEERNSWKNMLSESMGGKRGLKVLDVGTGPGFLALMCAEMGNEVTAIDLSDNMLKKAKENALIRGVSIDFRQGDAENLELPDDYFDVVMNKYLLWTLPDPVKALMEWRRVLKGGGMIIAIDGNWHDTGLVSRMIRATSDLIRIITEDKYPYIFRKQYDPLKKSLPLFSLKPEKVIHYFNEAGFDTVSIEKMDKLCSSARKKGKILDKLDFSNPIYLIKATK
ncbi:MAG: methyltransferase domain-containing protein [Methanomethylovorans sp.]|jgi:ubiquinone/menaquinone biosynthesis C-methylase UbiE|nr:methyltransferase domain-containing protein [Methanomethylovorans sp.]